jgi:Raf kinase inhibitor-like YbhB/YbcL family protein
MRGNDKRGPSPTTSTGSPATAEQAFGVRSPDFQNGGKIPRQHASRPEGENVPPRLEWSGAPVGARGFALTVDDPDAPRAKPFVHWVVAGIPPTSTALSLTSTGLAQGKNDFGGTGWGGPLPPPGSGPHHYRFHLYALDARIDLPPEGTKDALLAAMRGHVLAEAETVGTYER